MLTIISIAMVAHVWVALFTEGSAFCPWDSSLL